MSKPTIAQLQEANAKLLAEIKSLRKKEEKAQNIPNPSLVNGKEFDDGSNMIKKIDSVYSAVNECHDLVSHIQSHNSRIRNSVAVISGGEVPGANTGAPARSGTLGILLDLRDRLGDLNSSINENASNLETILG